MTKFNRLWKCLQILVLVITTIVTISVVAFVMSEAEKEDMKKELFALNVELAQKESTAKIFFEVTQRECKDAKDALEEVKAEAQKAINGVVCSEVNRYNTNAQNLYAEYLESKAKREESIIKYTEAYESCEETLVQILKLEQELGFDYLRGLSVYSPEALIDVTELEEEVTKLLSESNEKAESLYNEYYELMVCITNAEVGASYCSDFDQFCVMNVIENRVRSSKFPNTVEEVIFQPGQYSPTWNGSWDKEADERTKSNVKKYLLGQVDTKMPENVLYQAMFPQGDYIWKHVSNPVDAGHYYCGEYN